MAWNSIQSKYISSMSIEKIKQIVGSEKIKVVSFDLFDTLLLRPCDPYDIVYLLSKKMNKHFDHVQRIRSWKHGWWVTVPESEVRYAGTNEERLKYRAVEMDIELTILRPRKAIQEIYNYVKSLKKTIIITTDMYLPMDFIKKLLIINGYDTFDKIYLSNKTRSKSNKKQYEAIKEFYEKISINPDCVVHIGDNWDVDYINAKESGINSIWVPRPYDMFCNSTMFESMTPYTLGDKILCCYLANILYGDPFTEYKRLDISLISYLIGQYLFGFTKWMIDDSNQLNVDKILLVMSDGYILTELLPLFNEYMKVPSYSQCHLNKNIRTPVVLYYGGIPRTNRTMPCRECFNADITNSDLTQMDVMDVYSKYNQKFIEERYRDLLDYLEKLTEGSNIVALFDVGYHNSAIDFINAYYPTISNIKYEYQVEGTPGNINIRNYTNITYHKVNKYSNELTIDDFVKCSDPKDLWLEKRNGGKYVTIKKTNYYRLNPYAYYVQRMVVQYCKDIIKYLGELIPHLSFTSSCPRDVIVSYARLYDGDSIRINIRKYVESTIQESDIEKMINYFKKDDEDPLISASLARLYIDKRRHNQNYEKSTYYMRKAFGMLPNFGVELCSILWKTNTDKSLSEMIDILHPLVDSGDTKAMALLGKAYKDGKGVAKDLIKAKQLLLDSIRKGNDTAINDYVEVLWKINSPDNYEELFDILKLQVKEDNAKAMTYLAIMYREQKGVEMDYLKSAELLRKASSKGLAWAKNELFTTLWKINTNKTDKEMIECIQPLVEVEDGKAMGNLAKCYLEGRGVDKNIEKAKELLQKASDKNITWAKRELSRLSMSD